MPKGPEIELGQALFSNSSFHEHDVPDYIDEGLALIARAVKEKRNDSGLLISNDGEEKFVNDIFALRSFCWCDGDRKGHEEECPPNFSDFISGLNITWYKYLGRGESMNKEVTLREWTEILSRCLRSLGY